MPYGFNENKTKQEFPTKLSQFTNDSGFITNTVNNLTNYYNNTQIDNILSGSPPIYFIANASYFEGIDTTEGRVFRTEIGGVYQFYARLKFKSGLSGTEFIVVENIGLGFQTFAGCAATVFNANESQSVAAKVYCVRIQGGTRLYVKIPSGFSSQLNGATLDFVFMIIK